MIYVIHLYASLQLYVISVVARLLTFYILCGRRSENGLLQDTNACPKNVFFITGDVSVDLLYVWFEIFFVVIVCTDFL